MTRVLENLVLFNCGQHLMLFKFMHLVVYAGRILDKAALLTLVLLNKPPVDLSFS